MADWQVEIPAGSATKSNDWETEIPAAKKAPGVVENVLASGAAVAGMVADLPGAALGIGADIGSRLESATKHLVKGEKVTEEMRRADAVKAHDVAQLISSPFTGAGQKVMAALGYDKYELADVPSALSKLNQWLAKGDEYVENKTKGVILKEDAESIQNAIMTFAGFRGTSKGIEALGKAKEARVSLKPREEAPRTWDDPVEPKPVAPDANPASLAKQHIEETLNIKSNAERKAINKARREDVRAGFQSDPKYADYLRHRAEQEVLLRQSAAQVESLRKEAKMVAETQRKLQAGEYVAKPVTPLWDEVKAIYDKPGFSRTADDLIKIRQFNREGGKVDPLFLAHMAAIGIGAMTGIDLNPDHPIEGALLGATFGGAGYGLAKFAGSTAMQFFKSPTPIREQVFKPDTRIRIDDFTNAHESFVRKNAYETWKYQNKVYEATKDPARSMEVIKWMQGDRSVKLTPKEHSAALEARGFFDSLGGVAVKAGVLDKLIPDYVTGLWDLEGVNKGTWDQLTAKLNPQSRFALEKKIQSYDEGIKLGLKPKTTDLSTIMGVYSHNMGNAIATKVLFDSLKGEGVAGFDGVNLVMPNKTAPSWFKPLPFRGYGDIKVHPDILPSLKLLLETKDPRGIAAALEGIAMGAKRSILSYSLFHAKTLAETYIAAGGNPMNIPGIVMGTNKYLQGLRSGGLGPLIDRAYDGGLTFSLERGTVVDMDVAGSFYDMMGYVRQYSDSIIPGSSKVVKGLEGINHAIDNVMWARIHTGFKLDIFAKTVEELTKANSIRQADGTMGSLKTPQEINNIAAGYVNTIFGGLNWRRFAESHTTAWGRDMAMQVYSPEGRRVLQLSLLAPDWTIATTKTVTDAFGKGTGFKGLNTPKELEDLHRRLWLRHAIGYAIVGGVLNELLSGHPIWENKDKTVIDMDPEGRQHIQLSKSFAEPIHWLTKPGQQALNKLNPIIVKEPLEQLLGQEYLTSTGKPPPMDTSPEGRLLHLADTLSPIGIKSGGVSGFMGVPVYGRTEEQADAERERRRGIRAKQKAAEE